jgi:OmpA-OmpF porin, OOP family
MKMKKQIIIGLSLLVCMLLKAQDPESYLHFNIGCGLHNLSYNLNDGTKQNARIGYTVNAAYSYFFSSHWGVQSGVGIQTISGLSTLNYQSSISAVDGESRTYDFRTNYKNWEEKQNAIFIDIPLVMQYRHRINEKIGIIGSLGGKVAIPIYQKFESTGNGEIVTTGYYSEWNTELSDLPKYGFTTIKDVPKGNLSLKISYMAIADFGGLLNLSDKLDLYVGAYLNYGLNNILKSGTKEVYQSDGTYNGIFASTQTSKVIPITFGIKVGVYLKMPGKIF